MVDEEIFQRTIEILKEHNICVGMVVQMIEHSISEAMKRTEYKTRLVVVDVYPYYYVFIWNGGMYLPHLKSKNECFKSMFETKDEYHSFGDFVITNQDVFIEIE